jgi:hypothetical protein
MRKLVFPLSFGAVATASVAYCATAYGRLQFQKAHVVPLVDVLPRGVANRSSEESALVVIFASSGMETSVVFASGLHDPKMFAVDVKADTTQLDEGIRDAPTWIPAERRPTVVAMDFVDQLEMARTSGLRSYRAGWPFKSFHGSVAYAGYVQSAVLQPTWAIHLGPGVRESMPRFLPLQPTAGVVGSIAVWSVVGWFLQSASLLFIGLVRTRVRRASGLCIHCAYPLTSPSDRCPECGLPA